MPSHNLLPKSASHSFLGYNKCYINHLLLIPTMTVIGTGTSSEIGRCKRRIHPMLRLLLLLCLLPLPTVVTNLPLWARPMPAALPQTTAVQAEVSTVQRIRNRGNVLIAGVLYDYKPFGFLDSKGAIAGFDIDLVRALAAQWGIEVQFVPVTPSTRLQSLMAGQVDLIAAALPHTAAAETSIDFSISYFADRPALLLGADGPISLNALAGGVVAAVQGDSALAQLQLTLTQNNTELTVLPFQEYAPALLALRAGQADALLGHSVHLAQVAQENLGVSLILPIADSDTFALGVAPGDAHFRALVDYTLQELQEAGTYAAIYAKWFPDQPLPQLATLPGSWPYTLETLPATLARPNPSRLTQLRARGQLVVGVPSDLPPFGVVDATGAINGFDVELAQELARRWFGDATALELVRVSADTAIPLLKAGQVDLIIAALPHTWASEPEIDFSLSYFVDTQRLLVRTDSLISQPADLTGRTIATVASADTPSHVAAQLAKSGLTKVEILPFQEYRSAEQALLAGQVDALLGSAVVFSDSIQSNADVQMLPLIVDRQPYAIGIGQFDDELRDLVNITLPSMQADGAYAAIYGRWFTGTPYTMTTWSGAGVATSVAAQTIPTIGPITPLTATATLTTGVNLSNRLTTTVGATAATTVTTPSPTRRLTILVPTPTPTTSTTITGRPTAARTRLAGLLPTVTPTSPLIVTTVATIAPSAVQGATLTPTTTVALTTSPTLTTTLALSERLGVTVRTDLQAIRTLTPSANLTDPLPLTNSGVSTDSLGTPQRTPIPVPTPTATLTSTRPTTVTVLSTLNLNARTRPESTAPILMVLPGNTKWSVVDVTADGTWVRLRLSNGLQGWVLRTLLVEAAAFPTPLQPLATALPAATSTPVILLLTTPTPAPTAVATDGSTRHRVTATDTLATIAQQYYGQQRLWTLIYNANRAVIGDDPNAIPVGVELVIPPQP